MFQSKIPRKIIIKRLAMYLRLWRRWRTFFPWLEKLDQWCWNVFLGHYRKYKLLNTVLKIKLTRLNKTLCTLNRSVRFFAYNALRFRWTFPCIGRVKTVDDKILETQQIQRCEICIDRLSYNLVSNSETHMLRKPRDTCPSGKLVTIAQIPLYKSDTRALAITVHSAK